MTIHTTLTVFDELAPYWNDLLNRSPNNMIFNTLEWHSTWWEAYHEGELWVLACWDDQVQLIGIAPLFIDKDKIIRIIGCEDVSDYLDLIVDKDHLERVFRCFAETIAQNRDRFDSIYLCNIPRNSPTLELFVPYLKDCSFTTEVAQQEVCPVIQLQETWDDYLADLKKKQRHEIRRKMRKAEGSMDEVSWYIVGDEHQLDEQVDIFLKLMASSDTEKAEFLDNPQNVAFFKSFVPLAYENDWLMLNFLTVGGEPVASYLNFIYNNQVLVYNSGLNPEDYGHLSPGIVLLSYNIEYAIENDFDVFDFLRGDENYKYRMGGQDTEIFSLKAQ